MAGVLTKTFNGIIYQDTCESYPNGWTLTKYRGSVPDVPLDGEAALHQPAHAGTYSVRLKSLAYETDPIDHLWGYGDYLKLTKTIDVKSNKPNGTRQVRLYRGKHWGRVNSDNDILLPYDEFEGSSLNTSKWTPTGTVTVSNDQVHLAVNSQIASTTRWSINTDRRTRCFSAKFNPGNWFEWWLKDDDNNYWWLYWYSNGSLTVYMRVNGGTALSQNLGVHTGDHVWSLHLTRYGSGDKTGVMTVYKDGVKVADLTGLTYGPTGNLQCIFKTTSAEARDVDWFTETTCPGEYKQSFKIGTQTVFDRDVAYGLGGGASTKPDSNNFWTEGWVAVTVEGNQELEIKLRNDNSRTWPQWACSNHLGQYHRGEGLQLAVPHDDILIMYDDDIIIKALSGGQKIELYDSGGVLRRSATCPATGTDVRLLITDLFTTANGFYGYMKVYDTNGTTLLYTTATQYMVGGDEWTWTPNTTSLLLTADYTKIYRQGSGQSPSQAVVTATLRDKATQIPLSGKPINWSAYLGSVNPTSSNTDVNGQATTTFSPTTSPGLGGVQGSFAGDSNYGPSVDVQQIDVYYGVISPDSSKDFQVFIEGQEFVYTEGNYKLSAEFKPQPFTVTFASWPILPGFWWAVEIYRLGVLDFTGRIFTRRRRSGTDPQLTITGVDEKVLLQRRVANWSYLDDPKYIIEDLLSRYPTGITAGTINIFGSNVKIDATYESVFDALTQILKLTGWKLRLNANRTLDFASTFGSTVGITISLGKNLTTGTHDEDGTGLDTKVYVIGKTSGGSLLVSSAEDLTGQINYGLIEEVFLEKGVSEQGTLDRRAQTLLEERKAAREAISVAWIDAYATGYYKPEDELTVSDVDAGLSGQYRVYSITRNLADARLCTLQLVAREYTISDIMQILRKDVKDLGVV